MAYRRRQQGVTRSTTFKEEIYHRPEDGGRIDHNALKTSHTFNTTSSLAAQAIRASAAHRESSLSSAYYTPDSYPLRSSSSSNSSSSSSSSSNNNNNNKVFDAYEDSSTRNDLKGFWGILARKAKAILEDEQFESPSTPRSCRSHLPDSPTQQSNLSYDGLKKVDNPTLRKGLDKITSSLNHIGDTFEKAFEEGRHIVENKTADIIQETRKLQIRRKGSGPGEQNQAPGESGSWQQPMMQPHSSHNQMNHENQLKASRDVAMATAAKAKLLLRELKTVKADLAFAKLRCSQLEEENKILRESREKGVNPADDDLIRLQLETLLAEKARLAHENSVFARENRFLREIVEYHQLTMQDVVYLDECSEEVTEVYPITRMLSVTPPISPPSPSPSAATGSPSPFATTKEIFPVPKSSHEGVDSRSDVPHTSATTTLEEQETIIIPDKKEDTKGTIPANKEDAKGTIPSNREQEAKGTIPSNKKEDTKGTTILEENAKKITTSSA